MVKEFFQECFVFPRIVSGKRSMAACLEISYATIVIGNPEKTATARLPLGRSVSGREQGGQF